MAKNTLRRAVTITLLATLAFLTGQSAATAAAWQCPSGKACVWGDLNYETQWKGDSFIGNATKIDNLDKYWFPRTPFIANDKATSLYNNGVLSSATFWEHANRGGWGLTWRKKTGSADLRNQGFNDRISSFNFVGC